MWYGKPVIYALVGTVTFGSLGVHLDNCGLDPACRYPGAQDKHWHIDAGSGQNWHG